MSVKYLLALIVLGHLFVSTALTQDFDNYVNTSPQQPIPEDFLILSSKKFEQSKKSVSKSKKKYERKAEEQFHLENSFLITELLHSGKILFNEPISNYVNKIAATVTPHIPRKHSNKVKDLKYYVVMAPSVNAFATNHGTIFINMGLMAKIENDAQLAFVLCHEIMHFFEEHVIESYVETKKINTGRDAYNRKSSMEDKLLNRANYSKKNELEADRLGLELYLKTGYDTSGAMDLLRLLKTPGLPFASTKKLKLQDIGTYFFHPGTDLSIDTVYRETINAEEDFSSHPNIGTRLEEAQKIIAKSGKSGERGKEFNPTLAEFRNVQKMSRYELLRLYTRNRLYDMALYTYYNLHNENPNSSYLEKFKVKIYYGLFKHIVEHGMSQYLANIKYLHPDLQPYNFLARNLLKSNAYLLATENALAHYRKTEDHATDRIISDLCSYRLDVMDPKYIYTDTNTLLVHKAAIDSFDRVPLYKNHVEHHRKAEKKNKGDHKRKREAEKRNEKYGYALGINKVLMVDPSYHTVNYNKKESLLYLKSEKSLEGFEEAIVKNAKKAGLKMVLLSTKQLRNTDIEKFNEIRAIKTYLSEKTSDEMDIVSVDYNKIRQISKKYGTDYIGNCGNLSVKEKKPIGEIIGLPLLSVFVPYLLPFALYNSFEPDYINMTYILLYDTELGNYYFNYHNMAFKDVRSTLSTSLYYNFIQIKRKSNR